jgi:surface antigen
VIRTVPPTTGRPGTPRRPKVLPWLVAALALAGCGGVGPVAGPPAGRAWQPPPRPLLASLGPADELIAAAAMTAALDRPEADVPLTWRNPASGASGAITVRQSFLAAPKSGLLGRDAPAAGEGLVCRRLEERVEHRGRSAAVEDVACRIVDRWQLVPAKGSWSAEASRRHRVDRRDRLAALAKATGVPVEAIRLANPGVRDPVPAGTVLRLPEPR